MFYKSILIALSGIGNERRVVQEGYKLAEATGAELSFIHVNPEHAGELTMMMDSPGPHFDKTAIQNKINKYGYATDKINIIIESSDYIQKTLSKVAQNYDLLILGHRKMSTFKEKFFDSIDEGIINNIDCPVLVIPKPV